MSTTPAWHLSSLYGQRDSKNAATSKSAILECARVRSLDGHAASLTESELRSGLAGWLGLSKNSSDATDSHPLLLGARDAFCSTFTAHVDYRSTIVWNFVDPVKTAGV